MKPTRVLVVLNSLSFFGMERTVLEVFDIVRPEVEPRFLIPRSNERYDRLLLEALRQKQFAFSFLSDDRDWPLLGAAALRSKPLRFAEAIMKGSLDVHRLARQADTIYLPNISGAYLTCLSRMLAPRRTVYQFHDVSEKPSPSFGAVQFTTDAYVHYTETSYRIAAAAYPRIRARENHVAPVYSAYRPYAPDPEADAALASGRHIVFAGQLAWHKGVDLLLAAFARIQPRFPEVRLDLLGTADEAYEPRMAAWRAAAGGAADMVRFWGYREDVFRFLERATVYAHPTPPSRFTESLGRGPIDALRCGVPTVCFASGAMAETVIPGETGLVCGAETADEVAAALERLLGDSELRGSMRQHCLRRFQSLYSVEEVRRRWIGILRGGAV